ncbi:MAG: type II secretion system protein GspD [Proteobacteria bacterium]|nr:type II secretion system protein GspD [Pseudomonadota bacterium]
MQQGQQEPLKRHTILRGFISAALFCVVMLCAALFPVTDAPAQDGPSDSITLDFEDVDIRSLIRYMAEATGRNFIVDNQLSGKVTIVNPTPLSTAEAFEIFESLLNGAGYAIVPSGSVDRIVPLSEVSKEPVEVLSSGERTNRPAAFVTKNIKLKFVHVNSVVPIIRPLLSKTATLGAFVPGNMLIVTETFGNIERIENVLRQLDTASGAGAIKLIPLQYADATQVAAILERIYDEEARTNTTDSNSAASRKVQIIPEAATNTLIVVADAAEMRQIEKLVDNLDVDGNDKVKSLEIVYLKNADAPDLADVINKMLEKTEDEKDKTNTDANGESKTQTALKILSTFKGPVSVVADKSTNALLLSAEPEDMIVLKDVINKLDIRRLQVYVEALVMEVSSQIADQFGVEWRTASNFGSNSGIVPFGGSTFGNGINALSTNPLNLPTGFSFGLAGSNITFRGQEFANIGMLVRALKSDTNINILSTPQLLTLDNQEAEIIVGDNVPFVTGTFSNDAGGENPFQTIERKDIGLTLRMTPQISENGFIRMDIYQEFSSVAENRGEAADLVTRKRSIKTAVVVPDQQMIVLGGLIRDDVNETNQQIPCLAGIFGAGELFKNTSVTNQKTNLMVFIKPHIINTYGDIEAITHSKYTQIREYQKAKRRPGSVMVERITPQEAEIVPDYLRDGKRDSYVSGRARNGIAPVQTTIQQPEATPVQTAPTADPIELKKPAAIATPEEEEAPRAAPLAVPQPGQKASVTPSEPIALKRPAATVRQPAVDIEPEEEPVAPAPAPQTELTPVTDSPMALARPAAKPAPVEEKEPVAPVPTPQPVEEPASPLTLTRPAAKLEPVAPVPQPKAPSDPIALKPVAAPKPAPVVVPEVVEDVPAPVVAASQDTSPAPSNPLDSVALKRPPEDTSIHLQDPSAPTEPLPALDLEKPAKPMPNSLKEPIVPMTLAPKTAETAPPAKPLSLSKPVAPKPLALKSPKKPEPVITEEANEEAPTRLAAVATPDTHTDEGELAPTGTLPQPEWSPDDLSFPLPVAYVGFDGDSILMNSYYRGTLDSVASQLQGKPRLMLEVRGYAPYDKGAEGRKRALARAVAVRNYLIAAGLPGGQIETYASLSDDADMLKANRVDVLRAR